jgi:hypothetical protein
MTGHQYAHHYLPSQSSFQSPDIQRWMKYDVLQRKAQIAVFENASDVCHEDVHICESG